MHNEEVSNCPQHRGQALPTKFHAYVERGVVRGREESHFWNLRSDINEETNDSNRLLFRFFVPTFIMVANIALCFCLLGRSLIGFR